MSKYKRVKDVIMERIAERKGFPEKPTKKCPLDVLETFDLFKEYFPYVKVAPINGKLEWGFKGKHAWLTAGEYAEQAIKETNTPLSILFETREGAAHPYVLQILYIHKIEEETHASTDTI